jgi:hypothetical protein
VAPPSLPDTAAPTLPLGAPSFITATSAQDLSGNWKPGLYNGVFPSGGKLNAGVYKIINVASSITLGAISNVIAVPSGAENANGAVSIVLDSSDTGNLDMSLAQINGLDDLHPLFPQYVGPRDPQGTHNFVVWGGNGATGYKGTLTIGPGASTDVSGIVYLPQTAYNSNGNSSPIWNGSFWVASMTVNGGGNGRQVFNWVCNLSAVNGNALLGGLVR